MSFDKFEKYSSKKLSDHASELDTDALWDVLEPQLEKPEKRRRFIFWVLGFGLLVGIGAFGFNMLNINGLGADGVVLEEEQKEHVASAQSVISDPNQRLDSNKEITISEEKSALNSVVSETEKIKGETSIAENISNIKTSKKEREIGVNTVKTVSKGGVYALFFDGKKLPESEKLFPLKTVVESGGDFINSEESRAEILPINLLQIENSILTDEERKPGELPKIELLNAPRNWQYSVGACFGYSLPSQKMTAKTSDSGPFLQKRKSTETGLELLSAGVDFELKNRNNWSILGGISGNRLTERFDFENEYTDSETLSNQVVTLTYRENGDILASIGEVDREVDYYEFRKVYNTFDWMEVHVGGGYSRNFNRVSFGVFGGALYGFRMKTKGVILDDAGGYFNLRRDGNSVYKSTPGIGLFSKVKIEYRIVSNVSLSTEFSIKKYTNSFTKASYPIDINYQFAGGSLGLGYRF